MFKNRRFHTVLCRPVIASMALCLGLTASDHPAFADALVVMKGGRAHPGIVTSWTGSGRRITLGIKTGEDAHAVADAIRDNLERAKVKVRAGKILVIGKSERDLLRALADIDFGKDDLGAVAAAAMDYDDFGSGSSLRAKKTADLAKLLGDRKTTAMGRVRSVSWGKVFPAMVVEVQILRGPVGPLGKQLRKGKKVNFIPVLKTKGGAIDWTDENTQINLGARYLKRGDKVRIKIGAQKKNAYEAELISR